MRAYRKLLALISATAGCCSSAYAQTASTGAGTSAAMPAVPDAQTQTQVSAPASPAAGSTTTASAPASDDIVVTARGRTQALQDVPISVAVTTGASLERSGIRNLEDLSTRVPGFRIGQSPTSDNIAIRGVGSSNNQGFEQSVGTFVDGIYRAKSKSSRAILFDVDRVEVLKGPQTTFFGNNTIAGALNITTRKPSRELEAGGSAYYVPTTGEYIVDTAINVPVNPTLDVRLAGRFAGMNGYIKDQRTGSDGPHNRDAFGRFSVEWRPTDAITVNSRLDLGRMRDRGTWDTEVLNCPPDPAFGPARGLCTRYLATYGAGADNQLDGRSLANSSFFNLNLLESATTITVDLGGPKLLLTTGYHQYRNGMLTEIPPVGAAGSAVGTTHNFPIVFNERYHQVSQEVRLQSEAGRTLEYTVGAYYFDSDVRYNNFIGQYFLDFAPITGGLIPSGTPIALRVINGESDQTLSAFGALTIRPVQPLRVNLGLRYTTTRKDATRSLEVGSGGDIPGDDNFQPGPALAQSRIATALGYDVGPFLRPHRRDSRLLPSVSVQYDVLHDVMAYASYTKGFKAGGYAVLVSRADFGPETVDAYEVGLKTRLFDRRLTFNTTAFLMNYKDLQETLTVPTATGSVQYVANVASARSKGVELETTLNATSELTFSGNLAYLDAVYSDYPSAPCTPLQTLTRPAPCTQSLSGRQRAFAPRWSTSGGITYTRPIGAGLQARLNTAAYYTSFFYQSALLDPYVGQHGYAKLDARIALARADNGWEIAVVGKNLTNYISATYRIPLTTSPGTYAGLSEVGRTVGVQATVKF